MAKRPVKPSAKANEATASLIGALKFVSVAQKLTQLPFTEYCFVGNRRIVAFDGVLAAGAIIDNDLSACPHSKTLLTALSKCGASLQITQLANQKLSIKSGAFKAAVECAAPALMQTPPDPDPPLAPLGNSLLAAFQALGWIVAESGDRMIECAILLRKNTAVATDGKVLQEYWHGWDMPEINLPASTASAIIKIGKPLKAFGYSGRSITFWFEDDSWIRSQLYEDKYPDVDRVLNVKSVPQPIPEGLNDALSAVASFVGNDGAIIFDSVGISTSVEDNQGAVYEISGFTPGCFNIEHLQEIAKFAKTVDMSVKTPSIEALVMAFFGENTRGILAPMRMPVKSVDDKVWKRHPDLNIHWFYHPESDSLYIHKGEIPSDLDPNLDEITYERYIEIDRRLNPSKYDMDKDIPF